MIIIFYILLFITDGLINNANSLVLSITILNNITYKKGYKYYLLLGIIGVLIDIIFTETLFLNSLIFPMLGFIIMKLNKYLKESIITNILTMYISLILYKILMISIIFVSTAKIINVFDTLKNSLYINTIIIVILNTKEIYLKIKKYLKRKIPKMIEVRLITANLKLNTKRKQTKEIYILIIIAILSIIGIIYKTKNEEVINTSISYDLIKNIEVINNNNAYDNIIPNINGNKINFNINFQNINSYIEYKVKIINSTKETINLKDYKIESKYNIKLELIDINNIIILPNNEKEFKLRLKYYKNEVYNLPINNANINVELTFK